MTLPRVSTPELHVTAVHWPEVRPGDDLVELILSSLIPRDGDVLALTSKVVSKSEGRGVMAERADVVAKETVRVVARRGSLTVAETRHGLVMAAAGVDASNIEPGIVVALPVDPDGTARRLRSGLWDRTRRNVAVVVTDTAGRPWRIGQTDIAVGCAGLPPVVSMQGALDSHGQELSVTAPALADEVAAAGDLAKGKVSGCPVAVLRGLGHLVLPAGEHGAGAAGLLRTATDDLFGLGSRDAAVAVIARDDPEALAHLPSLAPDDADPFARLPHRDGVHVVVQPELSGGSEGLRAWSVTVAVDAGAADVDWFTAGRVVEAVHGLAAAHRLVARPPGAAKAEPARGLTVVDRSHWVTS
jgi:coenzyme F420-0:L-glutamate ligase/coenzyme F420-1:gamma-L-glutamate ligase